MICMPPVTPLSRPGRRAESALGALGERHESAPGQGQKSALLGRGYSQARRGRPTPEFLLSEALEADDEW
jgi:hypothetical protein